MKTLIYGFRNMFVLDGRATRKQYWIFRIWALLIPLFVGWVTPEAWIANEIFDNISTFLMYWVWFIPCFTFAVRRLHDINKTAKLAILFYGSLGVNEIRGYLFGLGENPNIYFLSYVFLCYLCIGILGILLFVKLIKKGNYFDNDYGKNPYIEREEKLSDCLENKSEGYENIIEQIVRWIFLLPVACISLKISSIILEWWFNIMVALSHRYLEGIGDILLLFIKLAIISGCCTAITAYVCSIVAPKHKKIVFWLSFIGVAIVFIILNHYRNVSLEYTAWKSIGSYIAIIIGIISTLQWYEDLEIGNNN